jgi:hypothetical protein
MEATIQDSLKNALEAAASGGYVPGEAKFTRRVVEMGTATALTRRAVEDSGIILLVSANGSVVTLPAAASCKGMEVTIINVSADAASAISISPAATDNIIGSVVGKTGASAATIVQSGEALDKDWVNTDTTHLKGDFTTLVSDGVLSWHITDGLGEWASEP